MCNFCCSGYLWVTWLWLRTGAISVFGTTLTPPKESPCFLSRYVILCVPSITWPSFLNISLTPGRCGCNPKFVTFKLSYSYQSRCLGTFPVQLLSGEFLKGLTDDKSTVVQVKAWYRQAASHYDTMLTQLYVTIWRHQATMSLRVLCKTYHIYRTSSMETW